MPKAKQPTIKQRAAFNNTLEAIKSGKDVELKEIMIKSGYSPATARNPEANLTSKPQWNQLLAIIDDQMLLAKLSQIAMDEDKRASIAAIVELFKLKDKYPANKMKVSQYSEELNQF